jgi:cytochrome P450
MRSKEQGVSWGMLISKGTHVATVSGAINVDERNHEDSSTFNPSDLQRNAKERILQRSPARMRMRRS